MIVKKIKREKSDKPKTWQIGDLVDYIRNPQNAHEKIAHAGGINFFSGTHSGQKAEMIALAQESIHSAMPVSHWVFSFKENEQPSRQRVDELVDIFLEHMGLQEHQAVYGLHQNTNNFHVHIAVNRMHPHTLKVVRPNNGFDIEAAHRVVALLEHKQGWASEENTRYTVLENGELTRARREKQIQPRPEARDFERATGEKSAQRIAQERGHSIIKNAASWGELHQRLAEQGLRFEKKGSGAIIFVGAVAVKASSVDRDFGMSKLCKRLGDFIPASAIEETDTPPPPLTPEPVSEVNLEEWQQYQEEKSTARQPAQPSIIETLKARQSEERQRILPALAKHGLHILNIAQHFLKLKQRKELQQARQQAQQTTRPAPTSRKPRFETWLRERGLHTQAHRWRHRRVFEAPAHKPPLHELAAAQPSLEPTLEQKYINRYAEAVNADRIRVTCIRMEPEGGKKVFILDKRDGATKGFTPEELRARAPELLRLQQRGENIYYTPLSATRHHILIDDMTRESVEKLYADGFRPAIILESSPGNYQCVLTFAKLKSPHNRDVGNRLTAQLNKEYGDPKLSGCVHPHRAPGFSNLKPKHRKENGSSPRVKLLTADKVECAKALELSRSLARELAAAEAKRQQTHPPRPVPTAQRPSSATAAYLAHFENIRRNLTVEDFSRVDAMIAIRLRASGYSQEAVADTILQCGPVIRQTREGRGKREARDWHRYAERTAAYAFGVAGDVALARNEKYFEHWRKIEGVEPEKQREEAPRMRIR